MRAILAVRIALGALGVAAMLYGLKLLYAKPDAVNNPFGVLKWAIASDIAVDGLLMPLIALTGFALTKLVPSRARKFVQGGLVATAMVTLIAIPLIHRRGKAEPGQALLVQDYTSHLFVLVGIIAAGTVAAYAWRFVRDNGQRAKATNTRPSSDQDSSSV